MSERRVALITGAAGGIGAAVVRRRLARGEAVVAIDLEKPSLDGAFAFAGDVTDAAALGDIVAEALAAFGRIDAVVHCAGVAGAGPLLDMPLNAWRREIDVNLTSAFLLAKAAGPALIASKGALVFLSSTNGRNGGSALSGPAYAAAKAGLINLARYLAKEWREHGVRVNAAAPGPVATPMLDRLPADVIAGLAEGMIGRRIPDADEIAAAIDWLLAPEAASVTGAVLNLSGGLVLD